MFKMYHAIVYSGNYIKWPEILLRIMFRLKLPREQPGINGVMVSNISKLRPFLKTKTFPLTDFAFQSCAQRAQAESDKTFHEMLQAVERWKAEINQMIMANMQAAMSQADGYVDRLEQEIMELQRRDAELRQILETEDNIHFLQVLKDRRELWEMAVFVSSLGISSFTLLLFMFVSSNWSFCFMLNRIFPPCVFLRRPWCPKCSSTLSSPSVRWARQQPRWRNTWMTSVKRNWAKFPRQVWPKSIILTKYLHTVETVQRTNSSNSLILYDLRSKWNPCVYPFTKKRRQTT